MYVTKVVAGCFAVLRQLNSICRSVSRESLIGLVVPLVLTRLDYCNAVLAGLPAHQLDRLQSVINAAARMIYRASQYDHVTSLLHWLRVPESIQFKLCALVYKCLNGSGPTYLADNLQQVTDVRSRRRLRSSLSSTLIVPVTRRPTLGDWISSRGRPGLERPTRLLRHLSITRFDEDVSVFSDLLTLTACVTLTLQRGHKAPCACSTIILSYEDADNDDDDDDDDDV